MITESKKYINRFESVILYFNVPTIDGKIYTKEVFEGKNKRNINLINEMIRNCMCLIEDGTADDTFPLVDLNKVAGIVNDIEVTDEYVKLHFDFLNNFGGNRTKNCLEAGYKVGITPYGYDELQLNEVEPYEVKDYRFIKFKFYIMEVK